MKPVEIYCLPTVGAFGHDRHIRNGVDKGDKTLTDHGLVINHHDLDRIVGHFVSLRVNKSPKSLSQYRFVIHLRCRLLKNC
jgi:hypothetical protein